MQFVLFVAIIFDTPVVKLIGKQECIGIEDNMVIIIFIKYADQRIIIGCSFNDQIDIIFDKPVVKLLLLVVKTCWM